MFSKFFSFKFLGKMVGDNLEKYSEEKAIGLIEALDSSE